MQLPDFNKLAVTVFEQNKAVGWWDDMDHCVFQTLQLVVTEIAEATEGERKNLMDDKLPHRKMGEVELADALIRLLDLGGRYGWVYLGGVEQIHDESVWAKALLNLQVTSRKTTAGMHLAAVKTVTRIADAVEQFGIGRAAMNTEYTRAINTILYIGHTQGYDVIGALHEKFEFNKTRADHQRAARAEENGKKF